MRLIVEGDEVADYVARKLGVRRFAEPYVAIGVSNGQIVGGVVFNGWNGVNIDVTGAGEKIMLTPAFLRRLSHYVFIELGCKRVSFVTGNAHAASIVRRLGAISEGAAIDWFGEGLHGNRFVLPLRNWKFR